MGLQNQQPYRALSFDRYSVKGLRNKDGTGVLVGLTQVGDVHIYIIERKSSGGRSPPLSGIDVRIL